LLFSSIFSKSEETAMSETSENQFTAALTFKVPEKLGLSVQRGDQSWTGGDLAALADCLLQEARNEPMTLSLSIIFELTGGEGTVRSSSRISPGDD
jgi:hypothetical protein